MNFYVGSLRVLKSRSIMSSFLKSISARDSETDDSYVATICTRLGAILGAVHVLQSGVLCGVSGVIFRGCVRPSSLNSSKARAGNGVLAFCFASVLLFIREELESA